MATEALVLKQPPTLEHQWGRVDGAPEPRLPSVPFGGTHVHEVDRASAIELLRTFAVSGRAHRIVTVNVDFLNIAERNPEFRRAINTADLSVADGMPLVWLSRLRGQPLPERVTGGDLLHASCDIAIELGRGIFLLGGRPGVALAASERLKQLHPGLKIGGVFAPPYGPMNRKNHQRAIKMIHDSAPAFLFVGVGAPRQDLWIADNLHELNVGAAMGVGGYFDVLAGLSRRAPVWMQTTGLEWAYRLAQEPRRLWKRYFLNDVPTLARVLMASGRDQTQRVMVAST